LKPVFIIAIVAVAMIGVMVPSVFAQPTDRCANLNPGALLMNCDLHGMDLSKKNLSDANLVGADLSGADLSGASLRYVSLTDADLSGADLSGADLRGVYLSGADLRGADLSGANLRWAILSGVNLSYTDLSGVNLLDVNLRYADLSGASLNGVNLKGADLKGADLRGADLRGADLTDADLTDADLSGANIYSTNFAGVNTSNIIGLENAVYNENSMENNKNDYTKNSDESQTNSLAKVKCGIGTELVNGVCQVVQTEEKSSNGGGCLIATATYGSEMATEVQQLRELRDNTLLNTESGTQFMGMFNDVYYSFSPIIADYERENPLFKEAVKLAITPMISSLSLMENANSESEVLSIGISVIVLNLGMYLGVPAIVIIGIRKRF
jgi:uncharacterized protein YjbI with pentapeptide repeats